MPPTTGSATRGDSAKPSRVEQAKLDGQLRAAAGENEVDRVAGIVQRGADVNAKDSTAQSAYLSAMREGYLKLLLRLTPRSGAEVNDKYS